MRKSGILMHISSLPSEFGIGKLGDSAYMFANFLRDCGVQVWQILPLSPTSYGDSPYQSFSVHAGNPYFIDFQRLEKQGYLAPPDYEDIVWGEDPRRVDYARVYNYCFHVLRTAFSRFRKEDKAYLEFCEAQKYWLPDYALFMALKDAHDGKPWYQWEKPLAMREPKALEKAKETYAEQLQETNGSPVSTYVPFRNGLFLASAASMALSNGCEVIYYGAHSDDAAGNAYPDCSDAFNEAMNRAIYLGSGEQLRIEAPFVKWTKADVVKKGLELGVPYALTWSCYEGGEKPCGVCGTCRDRAAAFAANGVPDPALGGE